MSMSSDVAQRVDKQCCGGQMLFHMHMSLRLCLSLSVCVCVTHPIETQTHREAWASVARAYGEADGGGVKLRPGDQTRRRKIRTPKCGALAPEIPDATMSHRLVGVMFFVLRSVSLQRVGLQVQSGIGARFGKVH